MMRQTQEKCRMDQMENTRKENKMGVMPIQQLIWNMSIPLMLSLLIQSLYNIVDGIFVAKLSETALTATSLAYPIQLLMIAGAVGTGVGVSALLSRLVGAGQYKEAGEGATTGLVLSVSASIIFAILGLFSAEFFAELFTQDMETAGMCADYLRICMLFCAGTFLETLAQRLLQAVGNTFLSMVSLIAGALTNIILDPIMIFGFLGFPALGIQGAAIATVIGQWVGAFVAIGLNSWKNKEIKFVFRGYRFRKDMMLQIYKVGVPTMVMQATGSLMNASINAILMPISSTAVAFFGAYYKLQNFLFLPMNGLGQAALPIVGFNYGRKSRERIEQTLRTTLPIAGVMAFVGMLVFLIFPKQLLNLFSASQEMISMGVPALRIISVVFVCAAVNMIMGYFAAGLGNGVINMLGTALRQFVFLIPCVWLLVRIDGIRYVWFSFWIAEILALACTGFLFLREYRKKMERF